MTNDELRTPAPAAPAANPTPEASIRSTLQQIANALGDVQGLTVTTSVRVLDTSGGVSIDRETVVVAKTIINLDGDREVEVPVILDAGELRLPQQIYDLHERHVAEAATYRKQMLEILVDFVKTRRLG